MQLGPAFPAWLPQWSSFADWVASPRDLSDPGPEAPPKQKAAYAAALSLENIRVDIFKSLAASTGRSEPELRAALVESAVRKRYTKSGNQLPNMTDVQLKSIFSSINDSDAPRDAFDKLQRHLDDWLDELPDEPLELYTASRSPNAPPYISLEAPNLLQAMAKRNLVGWARRYDKTDPKQRVELLKSKIEERVEESLDWATNATRLFDAKLHPSLVSTIQWNWFDVIRDRAAQISSFIATALLATDVWVTNLEDVNPTGYAQISATMFALLGSLGALSLGIVLQIMRIWWSGRLPTEERMDTMKFFESVVEVLQSVAFLSTASIILPTPSVALLSAGNLASSIQALLENLTDPDRHTLYPALRDAYLQELEGGVRRTVGGGEESKSSSSTSKPSFNRMSSTVGSGRGLFFRSGNEEKEDLLPLYSNQRALMQPKKLRKSWGVVLTRPADFFWFLGMLPVMLLILPSLALGRMLGFPITDYFWNQNIKWFYRIVLVLDIALDGIFLVVVTQRYLNPDQL